MDEKMIARFWAKVDKSAGPDGCWMWTAHAHRVVTGKAWATMESRGK